MESIFCQTKKLGKLNIDIKINDYPYYKNDNVYVWGFPYYGIKKLISDSWNPETLNSISGYYFAVRICDDSVEIANDILGGYRMYYMIVNNTFYIRDNYNNLIEILRQYRDIEIDNVQFKYWEKHRYTLNKNTLIKEIYKFSPASKVLIDKDGIHEISYFMNFKRHSNSRKFLKNGYNYLKKELSSLYNSNKESTFVMFYSGGADSTFLLLMCKELNIPLKCVLIEYIPNWNLNLKEIEEAKKNLIKIGQDYELIRVDLNDAIKHYGNLAKEDLLFNRHLAVHFYETYKIVSEKYGKNVVILNGQSADSILSFGPSEFTFGNYIKRLILAVEGHAWMYFIKGICMLINNKYFPACSKEEAAETILDDTNYLFLIDRKCEFRYLLKKEIELMKKKGIESFEAMRMYSKIIGFLQGSDNQVVIKSANKLGIFKVVMPFTSPYFIYNTVVYKNNFREIFCPKYFIRNITKKYFKYERCSVDKEFYDEDFNMEEFEESYNELYKEYLFEIVREGRKK